MANLLSWLGGAAKKVEQTLGGAVHGAEQAVQHAVQPVAQQVGQAVNNAGGQVNRAAQQAAPVVRNDAINILRGVTSAANNTAKFSNNTFAKPVFKGVQQVAHNPLQAAGDALGAGVQAIPVVHPLVDAINKINTAQAQNPKFQAQVQQTVDQQKAIANKIPRINLQSNDPNQIVRGGLNMAAGIVNSTVNAPSDLAKATTGYAGNLLSQGTNHPDSFTKSLPNIAGSVDPILNVAGNFVGAGTAANLAKQGVEAASKQGAKQVLVQGAKTGAKIGGQYGAASGALGALKDTQPNDNAGTIAGNTFMQAALSGATGAGAGAVLGAGGAGVGYGATKGVQGIKALDKAAGNPLANQAGKSNLPTGGMLPDKPANPNIPTIPGKTVTKTPQMIERIKNSPDTPAQVADSITGSYDVKANPETMSRAVQRINDNPEAALAHVLSDKYRPTVEDHTTAMLLAEQARKAGNYDRMTSLLEKVGQNAHNPAQALQILSQWGKTTPEGIVKYAQKITRDAYPLPKDAAKAKLTADQAKYFSEAMQKINDMPEGRPKLIETAKLMKEVENLVPASAGHKLQNVLYYAQLLNPKTAIRNIVGNGIFGIGENLSDTIAAPIDATKSLITGKPRSVYLPDIPGQLKAAYLGGRDAAQEAKAGVNLSGLSGQYGVANQTGTAFNNKGGRALDAAMSLELSAPDRAFYSAAEYQGVKNHLRSIGIDKRLITPENVWLAKQGLDAGVKIDNHSLEVASELGKYRTFQDDSVPATVLQAVKSGLNLKKEFGAGSFILNYPKTPGNLLARGLDFSPVGFLKATIDMGKLATGKDVAAGAVTRDISRALVGTAGLVGTGAALNSLGIITGRPDSNKSVSAAEKTLGLGAYKINTSALKRYVFSGLNPEAAKIRPGDTLISYDWAQPLAFSLTMGANLNETKGSSKGTVGKLSQSLGMGAGQVVDAMNSLAEQPVLQGLTKLSGGGAGVAQGVITAASSAPASFVPTLLNQINQLSNNQARSTYSPNPLESALKQVENKIPVISNSLQPQVNTIGQNVERYQGGTNSPFNVLLNPSFVSKYTPQNVLDEVKRLQEATGETKQFPDLIKYTQKIDGKNVQLTPEQVTALQTKVGKNNAKYMQDIMNTPAYQNATDIQKVNMLSSVSTDVAAAGRRTVLGGAGVTGGALDVAKDQPIGTDKSQQQLIKSGKKVAKKTTAKKATGSKSTTKKVATGKSTKGKVAKAVKLPSYKTAKFATPRFKVSSPKKSTFSVKKLPKYGSAKTTKAKVV